MASRTILLVLLISIDAVTQQPNTSAASLVVNAVDGPLFPLEVTVQTDTLASALIRGHANVPFVLARSATGHLHVGAASYFGGSCDLAVSPPPVIVANGLLAGSPFHTDGNGNASIAGSLPPSAFGSSLAFQAAVVDPASVHGFRLTAAVALVIIQNWTTTSLTLGDETVGNFDLGSLSIPFFGATYSSVFIGSNGYLTFGSTDGSDFTPSSNDMASGPPRIAGLWCDLECPPNAVTVTRSTTSGPMGPGFFRVSYDNVKDWGLPVTHHFAIQVYENGLIQIIHPPNNAASLYDQIVGISPGGGMSSAAQKDLSAISQGNSYLGAINERIFEWFGIVTQNPYYANPFDDPYDLPGRTLTFFPAGPPGAETTRYLVY